ncbi:hypothetical protein CSB45_02030 [candidate division KSB3 bacterium]|uniref:Uncharacterized protein n=1 Tax=candidate division KSB3 bacterium TaxID=2044937 RepID=A0A2G6EAK3_9BACT|nr:MAG: hypothetical protein CSB45_02030 [candidate division KSB3 bacterium]PIE30862.1 MAG: hypothetical protein CSA57_00640 [candidate division KSB3 bacterium]
MKNELVVFYSMFNEFIEFGFIGEKMKTLIVLFSVIICTSLTIVSCSSYSLKKILFPLMELVILSLHT